MANNTDYWRQPQLRSVMAVHFLWDEEPVNRLFTIMRVPMRRLASIVSILLLLTASAPVLACVTGVAMSQEESACCRSMHGQCGEMSRMGCCRTEVRTDDTPQLTTTSPAVSVHWVCVAHLSPLFSPVHLVVSAVLLMPDEHSPPGLITAKTTVLRI
jgi:hypothetical protein